MRSCAVSTKLDLVMHGKYIMTILKLYLFGVYCLNKADYFLEFKNEAMY